MLSHVSDAPGWSGLVFYTTTTTTTTTTTNNNNFVFLYGTEDLSRFSYTYVYL
jgi:hypothetical protein